MPLIHFVIKSLLRWTLALAGALILGPSRADTVMVAVASNFAPVAQRLAVSFERDTGHKAQIAVGASGHFYAQIKNGAPFHVLLSGDAETPRRLVNEGWAVADSLFTYAVGRLALWSLSPDLVDPRGQVLRQAGLHRLAVANPKLAPYGAAAMQALTRLGVMPVWQARLVQGENIAQAHQFVSSGNASLGLVAWSQISLDGRVKQGSAWLLPEHLHDPLRQDAVLLRAGQTNVAAHAWLAHLRGDGAQALIRSHGYALMP
ncbi:MAG: molybdate ABC transporter substrate-binding protein [Alphaproteobacteria bacterium]|nr:molybdate ABC transporter substrate-binding protein [Alphaproteobacteria bacterium]